MQAYWTSRFTACLKATGKSEKMSTIFKCLTENLFMWKQTLHRLMPCGFTHQFSSAKRKWGEKTHRKRNGGGSERNEERKIKCWNKIQLLGFPQSAFKQGYGYHMYFKKYCSNKEQECSTSMKAQIYCTFIWAKMSWNSQFFPHF